MQKLVVYYSSKGNTAFIAKKIAEKESADTLCLVPKEPLSKKHATDYFWGNKQELAKEKPDLKEFPLDPKKYDRIYVGSPVWVGTLAPPVRTFLSKADLDGKEVAFFCCRTGSEHSTFKEMKELASNSKILGKVQFYQPLKNKEETLRKLEDWLTGKILAA
jgi:flavodoxin